jgi:zinc transporter ZupT
MSCAALCKQQRMRHLPVLLMWGVLCLMTGLVAMATAWIFTTERISDTSKEFFRIKEVAEGLAAGAMLTCIAAAMIPEAIHMGGDVAGFVLGAASNPART